MVIFGFIFALVAIIIPTILIIRNYNYNHRFGEGLFKDSEYNLDEPDDFIEKNYYDKDAFKK